MILHEIRRPNSLKTVPNGVANCRNLPFGGRATRGSQVRLPRKENARSHHQCLFEEKVGKTGKDVVYELQVKGSGVVFMHGEGINTPHVRHKGRQPLIKCANMTSLCVFFPLFTFLCLFMPFIHFFYLFCGREGCFPCSYVSSRKNSDLRSSLRTKRWLNCFYPFFAKYVFIE